MAQRLAEIVRRQTAGREELLGVLRDISRCDMETAGAIEKWSVKDTLGHISTWDDFYVEAIRSWRQKRPLTSDYDDLDSYNFRHAETKSGLSLDEVLSQFAGTRTCLMQEIEQLGDEDLDSPITLPWPEHNTIGQLLELQMEHDTEHAEDIKGWLVSR